MPQAPAIILTTLNASYAHASLGLRYLLANMGELECRTALREFTIARPTEEIVDDILRTFGQPTEPSPQILGLGVYIWNVRETLAVIKRIKALAPTINVVLGGPEVSYEIEDQEIAQFADHVISGWGDLSFAKLCRAILSGSTAAAKFIAGERPDLAQIRFPYRHFSAADLAHRILYVEASRGCPFACEFCLSALDKTAWAFELDAFLAEMDALFSRGARNFKFVDRTFNLKVASSVQILEFFLERLRRLEQAGATEKLFLHFEVVPDHLPEALKQVIARFPPGVLQFEVGIQSFNTEVQERISRRQNNEKTASNLGWLLSHSHVHLHTDLIFGLPGETLVSIAAGFDQLYRLHPHEIQLGILKRLRGTPITRHSQDFGMIYDPQPPYALLASNSVDAATIQRLSWLSRYWDMIANSGRFQQTLALLLPTQPPESPFDRFLNFSDWLWARSERTHGHTPEFLVDALFDYLLSEMHLPPPQIREALITDYVSSGARGNPAALTGFLPKRSPPQARVKSAQKRQQQHQPPTLT